MRAPRLDRPACEFRYVDLLARENQPAGLDLAREQNVVDEVRKPLGLVRDDGQEAATQIVGEDDVIAREGLGGAVDRCDRSSQLMGDSGNEIRLELLQPPLLRPIAKRVDGPVREAHSGDREPEVPFSDLDMKRCRRNSGRSRGARNGDDLRE